ncbi:MAG: hypothetical protein KY445_16860 [Armatimonadetes bacterium]|nr:hypothetical protein [Armatimonadota bacterium]
MAGTGAFNGQVMVPVSRHYPIVLLYTLLFSVGVLAVMTMCSVLLGGVLTWGKRRSVSLVLPQTEQVWGGASLLDEGESSFGF